jgi:hypothetical protein
MPEQFLNHTELIPGMVSYSIGDFWRWAYSDVLSNRNRSIFAEFLVGAALGVLDKPRVEWDAVDLRYGKWAIEVKSSAYCQSWAQSKPSAIQFSIRKAVFWNAQTGKYEGEPARSADLYVFCLHTEQEKSRANVLNVSSWVFYVLATDTLNRECPEVKSMSLKAVSRLANPCTWSELREAVDRVLSAGSKRSLGQ